MSPIRPLVSAALIAWPVLAAAASAVVEPQTLVYGPAGAQQHQVPHVEVPPPDLSTDYTLLDIVLVASIDGKFHALNRTSGHKLWSMTSFATTTSLSAPSALAPLIHTNHTQFETDGDSQNQEMYIIEPQSGAIYVLHSPLAPLHRFPFSMLELIKISPFTSVIGENVQVLVGRKETLLLVIELETGRLKAVPKSQCPSTSDDYEELPSTSLPTEVYITRTDYHVSIHTKSRLGSPAPPVQKLSFSTYGPHGRDSKLQSTYRRTRDDIYVQPLPNGEIVAFRMSSDKSKDDRVTGAIWGRPFPSPIVAVFDVLKQAHTPDHQSHSFVLLQPRRKLRDLFTSIDKSAMYQGQPLPNQGSAYVGLVEETGSLFALSPDHYPLVVFGRHEKDGIGGSLRHSGKKDAKDDYINSPKRGPPPEYGGGDNEEPLDPCVLMPHLTRCLVGMRPLADNVADRRAKRLLDCAKP